MGVANVRNPNLQAFSKTEEFLKGRKALVSKTRDIMKRKR
jgi:hypothetical protein